MSELDKYEKLSKIAKSIGLTWVFNSIEGLEFAVEFFSKKTENNQYSGHDFRTMVCPNCGLSARTYYQFRQLQEQYSNQCKFFQQYKQDYNIENINGVINELFRNS